MFLKSYMNVDTQAMPCHPHHMFHADHLAASGLTQIGNPFVGMVGAG